MVRKCETARGVMLSPNLQLDPAQSVPFRTCSACADRSGSLLFENIYHIRPIYRTVRSEFFTIIGQTCGKICIHLY